MLVTYPTLTHDRPAEPVIIPHVSPGSRYRGDTVAKLCGAETPQAHTSKTFERATTVFTVVQDLAHSPYHRDTLSMVTGSCPKGGIQLSPAPCSWG